ncbi:helix-turn-helix domain-containing protein (plasmid) [Streptomyces scopuliridis]|uniref:helix-turn-helix domain-containing protein n=1 Tax=Streptomyces scopuliridis TaxID=452529 RepID=UPI002DD9B8E7|nr:helix-turn-helix transcriptional regulator [Streptomyces scopuliridis]WSB39028.1 helix-turn-helix domain-containing protein [Streptomyces scopuliridis]
MNLPTLRVGERVRHHRERLRRTQAVVAGLCGITEDYLSQIERGLKTPSHDVLTKLAHELQVPVATLLGDSEPAPARRHGPATAGPDVIHALLHRPATPPTRPLLEQGLRDRVERLWETWQTSPTRFTDAETVLPALIRDVETTLRTRPHDINLSERRETLRAAADLYGMLRSYCRRSGRPDLSLMCADRSLRAAEDADDPLRIAAAHWNLGHVLLSQPGNESEAAGIALRAADNLRRTLSTPRATAVQGALELVAVVAEARSRRAWAARDRLNRRVLPLAGRTGEGNVLWTVFGPTNVELHAVSVEMLDGDAGEGLRLADQIDTDPLASHERRFTFGLEVARCYDLRREDASVLVHLLELESLAPEDLERSPLARQLVVSLVQRSRPTYRRQVTALAERLHLL